MANPDNFSTNGSSTLPPSSIGSPLLGDNHTNPFSVNLSQTPSIKLDKHNFLLWKKMITPIIKGHELEGFILGTKQCPAEMLTTQNLANSEETTTAPNLVFGKWKSVDQLLMGWLYSAMSPEIAMRIAYSDTSAKLWRAIHENFGVKNKARINYLTGELQKIRRGNTSIDEYLVSVKLLADNLKLQGRKLI